MWTSFFPYGRGLYVAIFPIIPHFLYKYNTFLFFFRVGGLPISSGYAIIWAFREGRPDRPTSGDELRLRSCDSGTELQVGCAARHPMYERTACRRL